MTLAQLTVPNMAQGVSQQSAQVRRATQCEAQYDCLNQAVQGAASRPGLEWRGILHEDDWTDAFFYDIIRDTDERYVLAIKDGVLKIFNYLTGVDCTVTQVDDVTAYLSSGSALDKVNWTATSANDYTFLANKSVVPAMAAATSDARPPEALFWFRAGGYMVTYQISIHFQGVWYNWAYQTPDNSTPGNAEYIATDAICYALYNAMVTDPTNPISEALHFDIQRSGNIMRIWREEEWEHQSAGFTGSTAITAAGNTIVDRTLELDNDFDVVGVWAYSDAAGVGKVKIVHEDSSTQYDVVAEAAMTHPGGGWYRVPLAYTIPSSGIYRAAVYFSSGGPSGSVAPAGNRSIKAGDVTGLDQAGFTNSASAEYVGMRVTYDNDLGDFDIFTSDGLNNTQLSGMKERVGGLDDLPRNGFNGMVFRIAGAADEDADDYYVGFNDRASGADSTTQGAWEETVAPDIPIALNELTMPIVLKNTAPDTFTIEYGTWGERLAGDEESAKEPSFVGRTIEHISYDKRRLAIEHEAGTVWSRTRNPFVFFPDTVQTKLATAPIDAGVEVTKGIAVLKKMVQISGLTYLWAEGKQLAVLYGDQSIFSNDTIDVVPSSSFEWDAGVEPLPIGKALMFSTSFGSYASFTEIVLQGKDVVADTGITDHVPNFIPSPIAELTGSDTAKKLAIWSSDLTNRIFIYEYRLSGTERLQSAWNLWRLPLGCELLHLIYDGSLLYALVHRADGMHLLRCSTAPYQTDAEGGYPTRMDLRVREDECTSVTYDSGTDTTSVVLPFKADDELDFELGDTQTPLMLVIRQTDVPNDFYRGTEITITDISTVGDATTVKVAGDYTDATFYLGFRIRAEREESTFYQRSEQTGYVFVQNIQVAQAVITLNQTGYTRCEAVSPSGRIRRSQEFEGRLLGDQRNVFDAVVLSNHDFEFPIGETNTEVRVRFINDTWMPSAWQGLNWWYLPSNRAEPMG